MFKPHKGKCSCHDIERWILNKKGECNEGIRIRRNSSNKRGPSKSLRVFKSKKSRTSNDNNAVAKKTSIVQRKKPFTKKAKKVFGEGELFKNIWEKVLDKKGTICCEICAKNLGMEPRTFYFSHVLAKATFPLFRLWEINIWLCCFECHREWDQGDRSQPKFSAKRFFAAKLKQFYYEIKDLQEEDQKEEMKIFEYENN